jgi:hypothetical protein
LVTSLHQSPPIHFDLAACFRFAADKGVLGIFGMGNLANGKPDGSTASSALWVQFASPLGGAAPGLGALPLGGLNLGGLGSIASFLGGSNSPASLIPASGGGLGGLSAVAAL